MFGYNREELLKTTMRQRYMRDEDRTAAVTQFEKDGFFKAHEYRDATARWIAHLCEADKPTV